jgi:hypothetical protein
MILCAVHADENKQARMRKLMKVACMGMNYNVRQANGKAFLKAPAGAFHPAPSLIGEVA